MLFLPLVVFGGQSAYAQENLSAEFQSGDTPRVLSLADYRQRTLDEFRFWRTFAVDALDRRSKTIANADLLRARKLGRLPLTDVRLRAGPTVRDDTARTLEWSCHLATISILNALRSAAQNLDLDPFDSIYAKRYINECRSKFSEDLIRLAEDPREVAATEEQQFSPRSSLRATR